jgi:tetratricopeptide (TPR) repeat protein
MKKVLCLVLVSLFLPIYFVYALDWKKLHEISSSKTCSQAGLELSSQQNSLDKLYVFGLTCLNEHKDSRAKEVFERILGIAPDTFEAKWGLAEVMRRNYDLSGSEVELAAIIKGYPDFAPAYISLAYIKFSLRQYQQAVSMAAKVLAMKKGTVDIDNQARAYLIIGGAKGMIAHNGGVISKVVDGLSVYSNLKKAQKLLPDSAGVYLGLGAFYLLAPGIAGGDLSKALGYLEKAVALDPYMADAYVRLAQAYQLKGDPGKFEEYLNKALEIDPKNFLALDIKSEKCDLICVKQVKTVTTK